jgi:hypothetical protein
MKDQFQNSERGIVANLAVGLRGCERAMTLSASAGHKFTDSQLRIRRPARGLGSEALVVVVVSRYDDIGVSIIQGLEKWPNFRIVAVRCARTEERFVKVRERAGGRMRCEVVAKPFFFA